MDADELEAEADDVERFFQTFGEKLPAELRHQLSHLRSRIRAQRETEQSATA